MERLRIATRQSALALWQAEFIAARLRAVADIDVELVPMTTRGDRWLDAPLTEVGGKGLFIKELEAAMLDGRADAAVHSMKDLPAEVPDGFAIGCIAFREDPRDVLVGTDNGVDALAVGAVVGTSSMRRAAQLLALRSDLVIRPIRGNVDTRLAKLGSDDYDATVLAAAGVNRLALELPAHSVLPIDLCLPAAGQGALGVECRADDAETLSLLTLIDDPQVRQCVDAERGVSLGLGADCSMPVGAHARLEGEVRLDALLAAPDGSELLRAAVSGSDAEALAGAAVDGLMQQGAQRILDALG